MTLVLPLWTLLSKSFQDQDGDFVGLANYRCLLLDAGAVPLGLEQLYVVAVVTTVIVRAAGLRLRLRPARAAACAAKGLFQALALIPILAPSLLPAISLVYLFGNQGFLKELLFGGSIYGAGGIVIARGVLLLPARADDPGRRAVDWPTPGSTRPPTRWAPPRRASSSP